jgi:hypothetical protein
MNIDYVKKNHNHIRKWSAYTDQYIRMIIKWIIIIKWSIEIIILIFHNPNTLPSMWNWYNDIRKIRIHISPYRALKRTSIVFADTHRVFVTWVGLCGTWTISDAFAFNIWVAIVTFLTRPALVTSNRVHTFWETCTGVWV